MKPSQHYFFSMLALIAGALLVFAFAPFNLYFIAYFSPAILIWLSLQAPPQRAFRYGFLFGLGLFGLGVSWIYISIHNFGNANSFLAAVITAVFVMYLALFSAMVASVTSYGYHRLSLRWQPIYLFLIVPILWTIIEWLRGWLFTGFPWLFVGYTQTQSVLHGWAPLIGVYGLSVLVILLNILILHLIIHKNKLIKFFDLLTIILIFLIGFFLNGIQWTQPYGKPKLISLIQGNIPQTMKWDPTAINPILSTYQTETDKSWASSIIVWPEAAVPIWQVHATNFLNEINNKAKTHHAAVILGIPILKNNRPYNGILVLGNGQGTYLKRHLVPFGEYTPLHKIFDPLAKYLNIPMSDFASGDKHQPQLLVDDIQAAAFICYEIAYPNLVLHSAGQANIFVTVSDDSWFGNSLASAQQLQMAQMRALETGRPILYSTNTGITAFIDANGKITKKAPENTRVILKEWVQARAGKTPLIKWVLR